MPASGASLYNNMVDPRIDHRIGYKQSSKQFGNVPGGFRSRKYFLPAQYPPRFGMGKYPLEDPIQDPVNSKGVTRHKSKAGYIFSQNTRVLPAFGQQAKVERNTRLTASIMNLNYGKDKIGSGEKVQEVSNDPLKRDPRFVIWRQRVETNATGISRALIRPAAPGQVEWKNSYWLMQRTRALRPTRIGVGEISSIASLPRQSILYRISDAFSKFAGG